MKIDKGDKVIVNCPDWGLFFEVCQVKNVLEGKENKYVVTTFDGKHYLLYESELKKL